MQKIIRVHWVCGMLAAFLLTMVHSAGAFTELQDVVDSAEQSNIYIFKGDLVSVKVYQLTRIAISNPGIVDIVNADVDELMLIGQRVGETQIFIWDEHGKRQLIARVVDQDLNLIKERMERLLESAEVEDVKLTVNEYEGKIVATGRAVKDKLATFTNILEDFAPYVINLVNEEGDLIQIDVQVTDLSTTLSKALGFDWYVQGGSPDGGIILDYEETIPPDLDGTPSDFFKIGDFERTTALVATVNALINEGKGRVLSKPSIMVANGSDATLLIGGEIPVQATVQSQQTGTATTSITYKEYGIDLTISPEIIDDKIDLAMSIAIRDIDRANAVGVNVAFQTRSAETRVVLNDGQTIVIAGLIKQDESEDIRRVPFISKVPIVGMLFRSKSTPTPNTEQEVVISLTPRIYRQKDLEKEYGERKEREEALSEDMDEEGMEVIEIDQAADAEEMTEDEELLFSEESEGMDVEGEEGPTEEAPGDEAVTDETMLSEDAATDATGEEAAMAQESTADAAKSMDEDAAAEAPDATAEELAADSDEVVFSGEGWEGALTPTPEETEAAYQDEVVSKAIADYVQDVQEKISSAISFPEEAKAEGWEGTVPLSLTILSDGTLGDVTVKSSSGHEIFDKDAVATAKVVAPFKPFPAEMDLEELKVTIPIVYSQGPAEAALEDEDGASVEDGASLEELVDEAIMANDIPAQVAGISDALAAYIKTVRDEFEANISYPAEASGSGREGTVVLTLIILRNGNLNEVSVKQSSGHQVFDKDAISTTHILAPFDPFPEELKLEALVLSLPIVYKESAP